MTDTSLVPVENVSTDAFTGRLYRPLGPPPHAAVLVLHGSDPSAGFTDEYARLLASHGYAALRIQYVDTPTAPESLVEVPLEGFDAAIEWLVRRDDVHADRVGVVGWSRGSEAALLLAHRNDRVGALVGYVPSAYAFPAYPNPGPETSAWADDGKPVPYVPPYDGAEDDEDEPGVVRFRRTVDRASSDVLDRAALPVDAIDGPVLLVSGTEDRIWPSAQFAETLSERLDAADRRWPHTHLEFDAAGHAITVPYEPITESVLEQMGGTRDGTAYAATTAWEHALSHLRRGLYREESSRYDSLGSEAERDR